MHMRKQDCHGFIHRFCYKVNAAARHGPASWAPSSEQSNRQRRNYAWKTWHEVRIKGTDMRVVGSSRSMNLEMCMPNSLSMSPCLNHSSTSNADHLLERKNGFTTLLRSAHFIIICIKRITSLLLLNGMDPSLVSPRREARAGGTTPS